MTKAFLQVSSFLAVIVLSATAWSQKAGNEPTGADAGADCAVLLVTAPSEPPEALDLCHGVVTLDYAGEAWVKLPDGLGSRNTELQYQLTALGKPSPNLHVADEVSRDRFHIAGGRMKQKVSWQVVGSRPDTNTNSLRTAPLSDSNMESSMRWPTKE